ncbi:MAG: ABC transporter permease [Mycobacterium sp.]|uniref:ABC transporter permease n=1 Tax=Mycobacterium sp. TaxID=1785 RepID=UPI003F94E893
MSVAQQETQPGFALLNNWARPKVHPENSPRVLVPQTLQQVKRLLVRWRRDQTMVILTLAVPILFLLTLNTVLGQRISQITGHSALSGSVPMIAVVAAITGSSAGAVGLMRERADGLLARLWVLPVHRASGGLSRLAAEAIRVFVTTVLILCAGLLLGFRFHQGPFAALAWLTVPVIFGVAFATLVTTVAFYSAAGSSQPFTTLVEGIALVATLGIFFCTGFVPLQQYPRWIRPVVEHQPMSYAIEAMRGLSQGGPVAWPLTAILLWASGLVAVCVVPMVVGYRKASTR